MDPFLDGLRGADSPRFLHIFLTVTKLTVQDAKLAEPTEKPLVMA
jgi:hypothetical protein